MYFYKHNLCCALLACFVNILTYPSLKLSFTGAFLAMPGVFSILFDQFYFCSISAQVENFASHANLIPPTGSGLKVVYRFYLLFYVFFLVRT